MAIDAYLLAGLGTRHLQPRIGLRPSFAGARFCSAGPVSHFPLGDEPEQAGLVLCSVSAEPLRQPRSPQLQGMFEAQFTRMDARLEGRLRHQQADQVVSPVSYT